MMATCTACGTETGMPFTCKFCEHTFCGEHRLPENHDCGGLRAYTDESRSEGKIGYDVMKEEQPVPAPVRRTPAEAVKRFLPSLPTHATYLVLAGMFAAFILQATTPGFFDAFTLQPALALTEPWRLVTSIFLHANVAHLLVNSIVLVSFGTAIEDLVGTDTFLKVLFGAAIASSVAFVAASFLYPLIPDVGPGIQQYAAVGISGGLYGVVALLAVLRPDVTVLAYFIIPIKIRTAITAFGAMDAVNVAAHAVGVTLPLIGQFASAGHLGGLVAGLYAGKQLSTRYRQPQPRGRFDIARF